MRWLAGAPTIVLVLTACMPAVAPIADGAPEGPQLAIEVVTAPIRNWGSVTSLRVGRAVERIVAEMPDPDSRPIADCG